MRALETGQYGSPVGAVTAYWGTTAPLGWLLCDGAAIPAQYPLLIGLVGPNTPNLKGKVIVGIDAAQTEFDALGETGGAKTTTTAMMPAHDHGGATLADGAHNHGGTTGGQSNNHGHTFTAGLGGGDIGLTAGASNYNLLEQGKTTAGVDADHTHTYTTSGASSHTHIVNSAGSGAAGGNLPPYAALSFIIKAA